MAHLMLRIDDSADGLRESGDILFAPNNRLISWTHAQHICDRRTARRRGRRLLRGTLAEALYEETHQYRFTRVGNSVERETLATGHVDVFSATPIEVDGRMQSIDVDEFVRRAVRHPNNKMFGSPGAEVWYGGRVEAPSAVLARLWDRIEGDSPHRRDARRFKHWPFSDIELRGWLVLPTDDFDDDDRTEFEAPLINDDDPENPVVEKFRANKIEWEHPQVLRGLPAARVRDRSRLIELRDEEPLDGRNLRRRKVRPVRPDNNGIPDRPAPPERLGGPERGRG